MANLDSGNLSVNITGDDPEFNDFGGTDTYSIVSDLSGDVTVSDNQASVINLLDGLEITSANFLSNGVQFTVNDQVVTFLGAPEQFSFVFGGTPFDSTAGTPLTFEETAQAFGTTVPAAGEPLNSATITGTVNPDGSIGEGPAPTPIDEPGVLTWDENGILGNEEGQLSEQQDSTWGYFGDADQVRTDNDSEASVTFTLSIDDTEPAPVEENAVNIQITNFTAGDVLDVSSFAGDLAAGDTPVVTGVDLDDGVLGISMVAADPIAAPTDIAPAWNIEFPEIEQTLVDGLSAMGDGDLTAGLNAALETEDFWLVL
ncbi:hypothetical protein [Halochromatium salexigens]|uniref:Uncharacterized protein n=1 Tax=Halochromatium salexigens TaxID=49447 RepID=A0AAJ0UDN9_HALSE|nr:hypothetical protein [Halochromatium salexigens]MBK5929408.1 hypothetical protein [Halochromatium salexigens]